MRIAYLAPWRGGRATGPYKKIAAQTRTWCDLGHAVGLFAATDPASVPDWEELGLAGLVTAAEGGPAAKVRERRALVDAVLRWQPDVVYERHGLWSPALSRMSDHVPTVIEVNGDDLREYRLHSRAKGLYNGATRGRNFHRSVGLVHVTAELSRLPSYQRFGKPCIVVGNGIDLAAVPELPPTNGIRPALAWLGDPRSPFQSLEHLLFLAEARPGWDLHVIGPARPADHRAPNVTWHPAGPPESYLPVLAGCDIGIGTLDAYRTGMREASALKVREYLACGLATVVGYADTDFPDPVPHLLQLPADPDGLRESLPQLDRFVETWQGRRVPRQDVAHLDVRVKEVARLAFLEQLACPGPAA